MDSMQTLGRSWKGLAVPATSLLLLLALPFAQAAAPAASHPRDPHPVTATQETGFLNRSITLQGVSYKFQVYVPEDFHRPSAETAPKNSKFKVQKTEELPPIILFLHGRGERGTEGMWQT